MYGSIKLMIIIYLVAIGLILGSFVNALVWRFHAQAELAEKGHKKGQPTAEELSMVKGRSMCSKCHHELAPKDLVPLFSWLYLRGKCRYCKKPIEDTPLVELLLPVFFAASYIFWPVELSGLGLYQFIFWLIFLVGFAALTIYDLRWFLLPDRIVFPLIGLAGLQLIGHLVFFDGGLDVALDALWGVLIASGVFYILHTVSNGRWIGGGDVTLGIIIGVLVGGPVAAMLVLFIASLLGTIVALPAIITRKAGRSTQIPFGPYLMAATVIVVLWGDGLVDAYMKLLGV